MAWEPALYSLLAFTSAGIATVVMLLALRHRFETGAHSFLGVMLAVAAWSFVYAVQLGFTTFEAQYAIQRVVLVLTTGVPALWVVFTLKYTGSYDRVPTPAVALLGVEPLVFSVLTVTNPAHELVVRSAVLRPVRDSFAVSMTFGPAYYTHILYSYLLFLLGVGLLVAEYRRSEFYRSQIALLVLGPLPAFFAHVAYTLGVTWGPLPAVDPTPFLYSLTGVLFGAVQFDLLDPVPVARAHALNETRDGFVVLDARQTVVSLNPAASHLLRRPAVGRPFWECYPTAVDGTGALAAIDGTTFTTHSGGRSRTLDVSVSVLSDRHGKSLGWVVSFRDVTDRHAYEQRLEVAHRVLRHNLRNQMNVIHGWAGEIAASGSEEYAGPARRITETAERLTELSEKSQTMVATATIAKGDPSPVDVGARVEAIVARFQREHPSVSIEASVQADATAMLPDHALLDIALGNLLENAIVHNDTAEPRVRVTVEQSTDAPLIEVRVADNGPGVPEMERAVLEEGFETQLHHGSGLGLWLVYWCANAAGGEVTFEANHPRGSIVSVNLRTVEADEEPSSTP
jgi:signal transduction histidine kinase